MQKIAKPHIQTTLNLSQHIACKFRKTRWSLVWLWCKL